MSGYTRCAVCKRHADGRLLLCVDMDAVNNGEVVCWDPWCLGVAKQRHPRSEFRPYSRVKCVAECVHPPV